MGRGLTGLLLGLVSSFAGMLLFSLFVMADMLNFRIVVSVA